MRRSKLYGKSLFFVMFSLFLLFNFEYLKIGWLRFDDKVDEITFETDYVFKYTPTFIFKPICSIKTCAKHPKWNMVTFVQSPAANFVKRDFLRRTWASVKYLNGLGLYTVFVVGAADKRTSLALDREQRKHEDILQIYTSNTYLTTYANKAAALIWATKQLPSDWIFASTEDTVMVDVNQFQEFLENNRDIYLNNTASFPLFCLQLSSMPKRVHVNKHLQCRFDDCKQGIYGTSIQSMRRIFELNLAKNAYSKQHIFSAFVKEKLTSGRTETEQTIISLKLQQGKTFLSMQVKENMVESNWYHIWRHINYKQACLC